MWLHRMIIDVPGGMMVDHINGNRLDNRRCNLRVCTNRQNCQNQTIARKDNTSGYKGVSYSRRHRKWRAWIAAGSLRSNGTRKNVSLGYFADAADAARAYDAAARLHFGEFARCNFV
jgi:hypothetical protein